MRLITLLLVAVTSTFAVAQDQPRPNVVLIFADDLGYGDVQPLNPGSAIPTPAFNRLAAEGVTFTDAHTSSAVCTPSRYSLLTGRYCWRTRLQRGVLFPPNDTPLLAAARPTLGTLLQDAGYTTAMVGKWHLGMGWTRDDDGNVLFDQPIADGPLQHGFDSFVGVAASLDMVPYVLIRDDRAAEPITREQPRIDFPRFVRRGPQGETFEPGECLDLLADEAVAFIDSAAGGDTPFFLYFPLTSPHKPVWPADRFIGATELGPYGDFIVQTDATVGRVLDHLDDRGLTDHTIVIVSSDNGSFMYRRDAGANDHTTDETIQAYAEDRHRANGPWRGTKADVWEAGHRVPLFVRWPGHVEGDGRIDTTVCLTDVMATLADMLAMDLPEGAGEDSFSFAPLLRGEPEAYERPYVVNHSANGLFAVRDGRWKLVLGNGSGGREQPRGQPFGEPFQLYDLEADPGETHDRAADHPAIVERLTAWLAETRG